MEARATRHVSSQVPSVASGHAAGSTRPPRGAHRAQALVEFALLSPLLILLLGAVIDFGLGLYAAINLAKAVQDATSASARANLTDLQAATLVKASLKSYGLDLDRTKITVSRPLVEGIASIKVRLEYAFVPVSPGVQSAVGTVIPIGVEAVYALAR